MNNPRFNPDTHSPDEIKSEIEDTRRKMDDTIDALASRMKGRHLLDELIGMFRSSQANPDGQAAKVRSTITSGTSKALHSTVDAVKHHPLPSLLIGAGIAWFIYDAKKKPQPEELSGYDYDPDYDARLAASGGWEDDVAYDYPSSNLGSGGASYYGSTPGQSSQGNLRGYAAANRGSDFGSKTQSTKNKAASKMSAMRDQLMEKTENLRAKGREQAHHLSEQAHNVGERMHRGYDATRQRVTSTVEQHPLESAFACLALGIIAGLAIPTPRAVSRAAAPTARRLRDEASQLGHDLVERGKHVAESAMDAARETAEEEGLTPDALKAKASHVAQNAKDAATQTADEEGLKPGSSNQKPSTPETTAFKNPNPTSSGTAGI
jgi:ElaB/YqjD/DUF883 family membrane-anchored ribosome-binding protein